VSLSDYISGALSRAGDAPAITFKGQDFSWGWVRRTADAVEASLRAAGLAPDDPVGFAPKNRPEFAAALLGLLASGRHIVMIYGYQSQEAMAARMAELRLPAVVASLDDWGAPTLEACRAAATAAISLARDGAVEQAGGTAFQRRPDHARAPDRPGVAMLTSGTTGPPKHFTLPFEAIARGLIEESPAESQRATDAPALCFMPLSNISGIYVLLPPVAANRRIILLEKFNLAECLDYVRAWRPDSLGVPAAIFKMILDADVPPEDLSSLKSMATGAATLEAEVREAFERRYAPTLILNSYGATEFGGVVANITPQDRATYGAAIEESVGRAWAGAELRIVDVRTGAALPSGEEGRIEVRSPRMGPEWITTNDLGLLDVHGFLFHRGRLDGAIMRGGFKIVPEVVASALREHPAINIAVIVPVAHARLGEAPAAAYELREGASPPTAAELEAHLRARLPATHIPIAFRRFDPLPRTMSMKVDLGGVKAAMKDLAA
jgi:acyl-CoA synthetase (AMP-forming)/AMP-acid ligase II